MRQKSIVLFFIFFLLFFKCNLFAMKLSLGAGHHVTHYRTVDDDFLKVCPKGTNINDTNEIEDECSSVPSEFKPAISLSSEPVYLTHHTVLVFTFLPNTENEGILIDFPKKNQYTEISVVRHSLQVGYCVYFQDEEEWKREGKAYGFGLTMGPSYNIIQLENEGQSFEYNKYTFATGAYITFDTFFSSIRIETSSTSIFRNNYISFDGIEDSDGNTASLSIESFVTSLQFVLNF